MFCLANKLKINFPSLLIQHLTYTVENDFLVGYGNLLSNMFVSKGVDLSNEYAVELKATEYLDANALLRLKLTVVEG